MLPIDRPGKIICVGLNYRDHAEEQGVELPAEPLLFAKWANALIGPGDAIVIPPLVTKCDYEAELAVVIGSRVKAVSKENALEAVRGYLCANDVSARDLQFSDGQWTRGKSPDTFCPVGPALIPAAEIPDPHDLRIRAIVDGEVLQDSTTANLIFGVDAIVSHASQTMTLEPGDLILTGTPGGVGVFRDPQRFLRPGDEVTIEIEGLGALDEPGRRRLTRLLGSGVLRGVGRPEEPVRAVGDRGDLARLRVLGHVGIRIRRDDQDTRRSVAVVPDLVAALGPAREG